eukprot:g45898.t1
MQMRSKRCGPKRSHGLSIVISEAVEISKPKIDYAYGNYNNHDLKSGSSGDFPSDIQSLPPSKFT